MKRIEAQAVISAKDATGTVFAAIAAKIAKLSSTAKSASSRASAAEGRAGSMERAGRGAGPGLAGRAAGVGRGVGYVAANTAGIPGIGAIGAGYLGVQSYKNYAEAELALKRIGITADATDDEMKGLDKTVRDLANASGLSFKDVTAGLDSLVAGGVDLKDALKSLPAIAKTSQAAGAEMREMSTTALTLSQSMKIPAERMQSAFDSLVTAGKEGKFELKDMARYLPSILPAFANLGYTGEAGLQKIAALMQTVRAGTGTSEEAAQSVINILQKMESEETTNKFKKFGVDLRKGMDDARKSGKDLLDTFLELTKQATKGDNSKLNQLIADQQFNRGITAALNFAEVNDRVTKSMKESAVAGSAAGRDLAKVLESPQIAVNRLAQSWDNLKFSLGAGLDAAGATTGINKLVEALEEGREINSLSPESRAQKLIDLRRRQRMDNERKNMENDIRALEAPPNAVNRFTDMVGWSSKNNRQQALEKHRLRSFDLLAGRDVASPKETLFTDSEIKAIKTAVEEQARFKEFETEIRKPVSKIDNKRPRIPLPHDRPEQAGSARGEAEKTGGMNTHDLPPVTATLTGSADVKGSAEVNVRMQVDASPELKATVADAKAVTVEMRGMLRSGNGPGSTGKTSPDSGAPSTGASGKW